MTIVWTGPAFGSLYALIAVVFNIGMAQSAVFNFAAPQTVMVGAFVSYELGAVHGLPFMARLSRRSGRRSSSKARRMCSGDRTPGARTSWAATGR